MGTHDGSLRSFMYFSVVTYTSLGLGDVYPVGELRLYAGVQALIGLLLIGWSASWIFVRSQSERPAHHRRGLPAAAGFAITLVSATAPLSGQEPAPQPPVVEVARSLGPDVADRTAARVGEVSSAQVRRSDRLGSCLVRISHVSGGACLVARGHGRREGAMASLEIDLGDDAMIEAFERLSAAGTSPVRTRRVVPDGSTRAGDELWVSELRDLGRSDLPAALVVSSLVSDAALDSVTAAAADLALPVLTAGGWGRVGPGVIAVADFDPAERIARATASTVASIERGEPPTARGSDTSVRWFESELARFGMELPWDLRLEGRIVPDRARRSIELPDAILRADSANRELQIRRLETEAATRQVGIARSRLLPTLEASMTGRRIAPDLARNALGANPEDLLTGSLVLRQSLFDESAWAGLDVEQRRAAARRLELEVERLLTSARISELFLGLAEARSVLEIRNEFRVLAEENLRATQAREVAELATPADVARLRAALAEARQGTAEAHATVDATRMRLADALDLPFDAALIADALDGVGIGAWIEDHPVARTAASSAIEEIVEEFWVGVALQRAPEIKAVDELRGAADRQRSSLVRSRFLPSISLVGDATSWLDQGGVGSGPQALPGNSNLTLPVPPENRWSVAIIASLPLFEGGAREARIERAEVELTAAELRLATTRRAIELRTRTAVSRRTAAWIAAREALSAERAARISLDAARAAYLEGEASILVLLDAQAAAVDARERLVTSALRVRQRDVELQTAAGYLRVLPSERDPGLEAQREALLDGAPVGPDPIGGTRR